MDNETASGCGKALVNDMPKGLAWLLAFYMILLALVTVVENITVILATVTSKRQLSTTIGKVFLSLAITDFITGAVVMPCYGLTLFLVNMDIEPSCSLRTILFTFGFTMTTVSLLTLVIISVNRLTSVVKPYLYRHGGRRTWLWLVSNFAVWAYGIVMVFPHHFGAWPRRVFVIWFSATILITVVVPPSLYYYILSRTGKRSASVEPSDVDQNERKRNRRFYEKQRRISISCSLTTAILIAMYLPQLLARVLEASSLIPSKTTLQIILGLTNALSLTNSAVNPWIYAIRNTTVRNAIIGKLLGNNNEELSSQAHLSSRRREQRSAFSDSA